jgi:hypothetical protein
MESPQVLLIHSSRTSPATVQKLLTERQLLVHLSRTWEEAVRICTVAPRGQLPFVFVDKRLESEPVNDLQVRTLPVICEDVPVIYCYLRSPQALVALLRPETPTRQEQPEESVSLEEALVGESRKFREVRETRNLSNPALGPTGSS